MLKLPLWLQDAIALLLFVALIAIIHIHMPQDLHTQQQRINAAISGAPEPEMMD